MLGLEKTCGMLSYRYDDISMLRDYGTTEQRHNGLF